MAGIRITVRDEGVVKALERLIAASGDLSAPLKAAEAELRRRYDRAPAAPDRKALPPEQSVPSAVVYRLGGAVKDTPVGKGAVQRPGAARTPATASAVPFQLGGKTAPSENAAGPTPSEPGIGAEERAAILGIFETFFATAARVSA